MASPHGDAFASSLDGRIRHPPAFKGSRSQYKDRTMAGFLKCAGYGSGAAFTADLPSQGCYVSRRCFAIYEPRRLTAMQFCALAQNPNRAAQGSAFNLCWCAADKADCAILIPLDRHGDK